MEAVNLGVPSDAPGVAAGTPETRVHGTLHYGRTPPGNVHTGTWYTLPGGASPADGFHVYALEWEATEIRWYVDGVHYATQRADGWWSQSRKGGDWIDAPLTIGTVTPASRNCWAISAPSVSYENSTIASGLASLTLVMAERKSLSSGR